MLDAADGHQFMISRILKFLQCHVYPWETLYVHFSRKNLRHFDTSHSSAHEGTNHGLKSHSAGVQATMDVDLSTQTMNTQTNIRVAECEEFFFFMMLLVLTRSGLTYPQLHTLSQWPKDY